jgi:Mor family transcriptional regulator
MNETNHLQQQRRKKRKKLKKMVILRKFVLTRGATFYLPIGSSLVCLQHRQLLDRFPEGELSHSFLSLSLFLDLPG